MNSPSHYAVVRALVVSCAICAIPSAVMSMSNRSPIPIISFFVIAFVHGIILGVPTFWLLWWRKVVNAFSCAVAGVAVGSLPYALFFAPRMSGPGVSHARTLLLFALSGAAIGFFFWIVLSRRLRSAV